MRMLSRYNLLILAPYIIKFLKYHIFLSPTSCVDDHNHMLGKKQTSADLYIKASIDIQSLADLSCWTVCTFGKERGSQLEEPALALLLVILSCLLKLAMCYKGCCYKFCRLSRRHNEPFIEVIS